MIPFKADERKLRDLDTKAKELGVSCSEVIALAIKKLIGKELTTCSLLGRNYRTTTGIMGSYARPGFL